MDSWLTGNHLSSLEEIAIANTTTLDTGMKYLMHFLVASVNFCTRFHWKAEVKIISDYRVLAISSFL